jgi:hypothetical protein
MKNWLRYTFVATLLMAGLALPVMADDTPVDDPADAVAPTTYVYDDGSAVYYTRVALDGSVQRWVYDYNTDGTAEHVVLLPESLYDPITDWGDPVDVDLDGDGVVDGTYYVKTNSIPAMAVVAKLKHTALEDDTLYYLVGMVKPGHMPGWVSAPQTTATAAGETEQVQVMEQVAEQHGNSAAAPGQQKKQGDVVQQQDRDQDQDCDTTVTADQTRTQDPTDCDEVPDQTRSQDHTQDHTGSGSSSAGSNSNSGSSSGHGH